MASLVFVGLLAERRYSHGAYSALPIWVQWDHTPCPRLLSQPALLPGFYLTFLSRDVHPYLLPDKEFFQPLSLASIISQFKQKKEMFTWNNNKKPRVFKCPMQQPLPGDLSGCRSEAAQACHRPSDF